MFSRLRAVAFHGGVLLFWMASVGCLAYREAWVPWVGNQRALALSRAPLAGSKARELWLGIYADQTKIGYLHQKQGASSEVPGGSVMWQEGRLVLSMLGERRDLSLTSETHTDSQGRIARFSTVLGLAAGPLVIHGSRAGEKLQLTFQQGGSRWSSTLPLASSSISLDQLPSLVTSGQLKPGEPVTLTMMDPFSFQPGQVEVKVVRHRPFYFREEMIPAYEVEIRYQGLVTTSWFAEDGTILKEESPWGWTMQLEDPAVAGRIELAEWAHPPDFLSMIAVPSEVWIPRPREVVSLSVRLFKPDQKEPERITIKAALPPAAHPRRPVQDPAFARELAATPFIQVDDPAIRRRAEAIVGDETDSWAAAQRINEWVYRSLRKVPTLGFPVSTEALRRLEGDCNEHTCLFTALARAGGIPCRIVMGVVYFEGAFVYHTWPKVFVGSWVDLDPTLGQAPADATHIPLMEADLEESVRMAPLVGRLRITVESYR